jgi:hypothetical protein
VRVTPVHGKLDGAALAAVADGPVVPKRRQPPGEEGVEPRPHRERHRVARQDVLLAHRPAPPFDVNPVPTLSSNVLLQQERRAKRR